MKFSLLISVYCKEKPEYLRECLESVFSSTRLPDEIVMVKDGPLTAELDAVIDSFKEKYDTIKIVALPQNRGLGEALNEGLSHCSHELVARMDTDDLCIPGRFEKQLAVFEEKPEVSLVGGYITEFIGESTNIVSTRKVPTEFEALKAYSRKRNPVNHVTVMFKKADVLEVGSYQKVKDVGYEDYDLWIRLIMADKVICNVDSVFVNVRVGDDMYRRRGDKKRLKTAIYFRRKLWKMGYYSFFHYLLYSLETLVFASVPASVRKFLYKKILRK